MAERKQMVSKKNKLSIVKQCRLLKVNRSSVYHRVALPSDGDLKLMRLIDQIHLSRAYLGVRRITDSLRDSGEATNHKRVYRLMKQMGIQAFYPKPYTSKKHLKNKIYPYLLRGLTNNRSNHVWATDITYVPMNSGFVYLTVIIDWYSPKVLSWRLSNSMDSKAAWRDNVFVERLWRSIKYEEVYLNAYDSVTEAKAGIKAWINFYNEERKHQTLGTTPSLMYDNLSSQLAA